MSGVENQVIAYMSYLMSYLMFLIFFVVTLLSGIMLGFYFCRIKDAQERMEKLQEIKDLHKQAEKYVQEVRAYQLIQSVLEKK